MVLRQGNAEQARIFFTKHMHTGCVRVALNDYKWVDSYMLAPTVCWMSLPLTSPSTRLDQV